MINESRARCFSSRVIPIVPRLMPRRTGRQWTRQPVHAFACTAGCKTPGGWSGGGPKAKSGEKSGTIGNNIIRCNNFFTRRKNLLRGADKVDRLSTKPFTFIPPRPGVPSRRVDFPSFLLFPFYLRDPARGRPLAAPSPRRGTRTRDRLVQKRGRAITARTDR